eukprot:3732830-Amphidinium_carterae.1
MSSPLTTVHRASIRQVARASHRSFFRALGVVAVSRNSFHVAAGMLLDSPGALGPWTSVEMHQCNPHTLYTTEKLSQQTAQRLLDACSTCVCMRVFHTLLLDALKWNQRTYYLAARVENMGTSAENAAVGVGYCTSLTAVALGT